MKPTAWTELHNPESAPLIDNAGRPELKATELEMILKWGGDLTPMGMEQAERIGAVFRHQMYPESESGGVLRLHSTYRHDLKIKASDEGRVMKTAAAFTKGLLELEGQLTPILVSLVTVEERDKQMLDKGGNCVIKADMAHCKEQLQDVLQRDIELNAYDADEFFPNCVNSVRAAFSRIGNPKQSLSRIHELIQGICVELSELCSLYDGEYQEASEVETKECKVLYLNETFSLMLDRWEKLNKDFKNKKTGLYDLTKVPDVYDMVRYDVLHNSHLGVNGIEELLQLSRDFADIVVPQEYGISKEEKLSIGSKMCGKFTLANEFYEYIDQGHCFRRLNETYGSHTRKLKTTSITF